MDLRQIEYIIAIEQEESISKAAEKYLNFIRSHLEASMN